MQRVLVTGANKGIGLAIVEAILKRGPEMEVLLGSRDVERGEAARANLLEREPSWAQRLRVLELDVGSDQSVAQARRRVVEGYGESAALFGLVNNAGVGGELPLEQVLNVNVHGIRRVSEAFVPLLEPQRGRVANVTSASGPMFLARCSESQQQLLTDPNVEWSTLKALMQRCLSFDAAAFAREGLADGASYGLSKALANAYTLISARENPALCINACTPGYIETDMTRPFAAAQGRAPADMGMKPPEAGTVAPSFLLFGEPQGSGHFYGSDAKRSPLDRYRAPGTPAFS